MPILLWDEAAMSLEAWIAAEETAELRERLAQAERLLAQFALGYDTLNEPDTALNWAQVEALVAETRKFLTATRTE